MWGCTTVHILKDCFVCVQKVTLDDCYMAEIPGHHSAFFKGCFMCV